MPDLWTIIAWAIAATVFAIGASVFGVSVAVIVTVVLVLGLVVLGLDVARRARRGRGLGAPGFVPTDEMFLDPATGDLTRVYVNAYGERRYVVER